MATATSAYAGEGLMYRETPLATSLGCLALALVLGLVLTELTILGAGTLPEGSFFHNLMFKRGRVPHLEFYIFWLAIICVVARCFATYSERRSFTRTRRRWKEIRKSVDRSMTIPVDKSGSLLAHTEKMDASLLRSRAGGRLYSAVRRFHKTRSSKEVDDVLNTLSDMDAAYTESAYGNLRFFVWLIPTLGFIGTVLGISLGVSGFGRIVGGASSFNAIREQIPNVTRDLGVAFDTTLLALFLTAIVLLLTSLAQRRDEDLLYAIDVFCVEDITGSFEETDEQIKATKGLGDSVGQHLLQQTRDIATLLENNIRGPDLSKLEASIRKIETRLDRQISKESEKLRTAVNNPKHAESIGRTLEDLKELATDTMARMERAFEGAREDLKETAATLEGVAETLDTYVRESGVADAADFRKAVGALGTAIQPVADATAQLANASGNLKGLADLSTTADKLESASTRMQQAAEGTQTGGNKIAEAGGDLTEVIAANKTVLEDVKNVLNGTTLSIEDLSRIITSMNTTLSGIQGAVSGVQESISMIRDQIRRDMDR